MPVGLLLPERFLLPPDGPHEIDWRNPLSYGLVSYVAPPRVRTGGNGTTVLPYDLVRGLAAAFANGTAYENQLAIRQGEYVYKRHASQGSGWQMNSARKAAPITILIRNCMPAVGENLLTIGSTWNYDPNPTLSIRSDGSHGLDLWINGDKTNSSANFFSTTALVNSAIVADGTTLWAYKDAVLWQTLTTAFTDNGSSAYTWVGNGYGGYSNWELSQILIWNRVLPAEAIRAFTEAPYLLLRPVASRFYMMPAAGGATVIDLTAASFSFTRQSPQLRLAATLTAASHRLVANSITNRLLASMSAAQLSFSPKQVQASLAVRLTAAALNFTANAITLVQDTVIQLSTAVFTFSAKAITTTLAVISRGAGIILRRRRR